MGYVNWNCVFYDLSRQSFTIVFVHSLRVLIINLTFMATITYSREKEKLLGIILNSNLKFDIFKNCDKNLVLLQE